MKRIIGFFKQRWVISLLGLMALAALIWIAGPYFGFADHEPLASKFNRLVLILIIVLIWGLNNLRKQRQAKNANNQIIDGLVQPEPKVEMPDQSEEEIAALRGRFEEAMDVLKRSRRDKGTRNLFELPWYIIIGPPGCGKTTALLNSSLNFPLADQFGKEAIKGVGGTRDCDWWFTDQAILLDTAGRYTTQDSQAEVDRAAWAGFLDLLKQYRKRRPINGVLVAISVSDLMLQSEEERSAHVQAIKHRIQELYQHFKIRFPIYVLLTKCDLIAGFMEFFDDLGRDQRAQVWGVTFPLEKKDDQQAATVQLFNQEYDGLLQRLNERLLLRLNQERDGRRRSLIFTFPQQMAVLKETIDRFLFEIFRPSRYEERPWLRGIYFTSGTQEGTPIDRLMGTLARSFGMDAQVLPSYSGHGRSYFINKLFMEVVFQEAGLAGVNRRFEVQRAWLQRGAYAGALAVTVAVASAWSISYMENKFYIEDVGQRVEEFQQLSDQTVDSSVDFAAVLPRLDALHAMTDISREHAEDVPLQMGLGLYQGKGLGVAANNAYARELNAVFLPLIAAFVEDQLRTKARDPELKYETLKTYLMLGDPERMDRDLVSLWMRLHWQQRFASDPDFRNRLSNHLDELINSGAQSIQLDQQLIKHARRELRRAPLAEFVYQRFKTENLLSDTAPFRVSDAVGLAGQKVFVRSSEETLDEGIPGIFTYRGFFDIFQKEKRSLIKEIKEESWVLDIKPGEVSAVELEHLDERVTELYLNDYIRAWDTLLADIEIVRFGNVNRAAEVLNILSGRPSPLVDLLGEVERNTALTRLPGGTQVIADKVAGTSTRIQDRLSRLLGSDEKPKVVPRVELPGAKVDRHFQRLNQLMLSKEGSPPPIEHLVDLLSELYDYFESIRGSLGGEGTLPEISRGGGSEILRRIKIEATRQPEPVRGWLQQLGGNSQTVTMSGARSQLNALWKASVVPDCVGMFEGRYPFDKDSLEDVTLKDFGQFFGYGGVMDQFFATNLEPFVDKTRRQWRWRSAGGAGLGLSYSSLEQFQRAERIRKAFFQQGGQDPLVNFSLKPMFLDKLVSRFLLDIQGQQFTYRFGPARFKPAQWPGPGGASQVRVIFEDRNGKRHVDVEEGAWAFFRILDRSRLKRMSSDRLIATFRVGGREAKYEIQASSVINPFQMDELQKFRCPSNL